MAHPGKVGRIIGCVIKLSEKPGQQAKWLSLQTIAPLRHHSIVGDTIFRFSFRWACRVARMFCSELPSFQRCAWPFSQPLVFRAHAVQNCSWVFEPSLSFQKRIGCFIGMRQNEMKEIKGLPEQAFIVILIINRRWRGSQLRIFHPYQLVFRKKLFALH